MQKTNLQKYQSSHLTPKELHRIWWDVHDLMESNHQVWHHPPHIQQLCKSLNTNYKYLSQTINQATGVSITTYFQSYQIKEFLQKIQQGEAQLKTIEGLFLEVGFRNRSSFYVAFQKIIGNSPTAFIHKIREPN